MKKAAYFIPAIVFTIMYGLVALAGGINSISPVVAVCGGFIMDFGYLVEKRYMVGGGLLGIIQGACFIYMGTQETGQIIKETTIGVIILFYYASCIYFTYKREK